MKTHGSSLTAHGRKLDRVPASATNNARGGVKSTGRFRRRDLRSIAEAAQQQDNEDSYKVNHNTAYNKMFD